ncbi:MAG: hypothetical protein PVH88_02820 [Ignavibacteria bacterium]|jgi:hypothetical protein
MDWSTIEELVLNSDANNDWSGLTKGTSSISYLKDDVNIRIECSYDNDDIQNDDFKDKWANNHPNPKATGYFFNLFYSATLLKRIILVSVDGGNALLPIPNSKGIVKKFDYKIAEIFDTTQTLDEYLDRSGLSIEN